MDGRVQPSFLSKPHPVLYHLHFPVSVPFKCCERGHVPNAPSGDSPEMCSFSPPPPVFTTPHLTRAALPTGPSCHLPKALRSIGKGMTTLFFPLSLYHLLAERFIKRLNCNKASTKTSKASMTQVWEQRLPGA